MIKQKSDQHFVKLDVNLKRFKSKKLFLTLKLHLFVIEIKIDKCQCLIKNQLKY